MSPGHLRIGGVDEVSAGVVPPPRPQLRQVLHEADTGVHRDPERVVVTPSQDDLGSELYAARVPAVVR